MTQAANLHAGASGKRGRLRFWGALAATGLILATIAWLTSSLPIEHIVFALFESLRARPDLTVLFVIILMVVHNVVPIPAEVIALAAGSLLGPVWGSVAVWTGAMIGACLAFWMSRMWGQAIVTRILPAKHLDQLTRVTRRCTWRTLLGLRMISVISFNLVNYGAGLTSVPWLLFLWTTAIGILPVTVISVCLGARLVDIPLNQALVGLTVLGLFMLTYKWLCSCLSPSR